jgi:hypothetical protein
LRRVIGTQFREIFLQWREQLMRKECIVGD